MLFFFFLSSFFFFTIHISTQTSGLTQGTLDLIRIQENHFLLNPKNFDLHVRNLATIMLENPTFLEVAPFPHSYVSFKSELFNYLTMHDKYLFLNELEVFYTRHITLETADFVDFESPPQILYDTFQSPEELSLYVRNILSRVPPRLVQNSGCLTCK